MSSTALALARTANEQYLVSQLANPRPQRQQMFGSGPSIPSLVGRGISMNRLPLAIWAMVLGAFAMGADEFIVAGVVREIAQGLNVPTAPWAP